MLQFEILIKELKEENSKLAERAQQAEQRYNDLNAQMNLIQSFLYPVSVSNQDVQVLADISKFCYDRLTNSKLIMTLFL